MSSKKAVTTFYTLEVFFSRSKWSILLNLSKITRIVINPLDAERTTKKSIAILLHSIAGIEISCKTAFVFVLSTIVL